LRRRGPFVGPTRLIGAAFDVFSYFPLGGFILVDEIDPVAGKARLLTGKRVAALVSPRDVMPDLVFEGEAFGEPPLVAGRAIGHIDAKAVVDDPSQRLKVGGLDDLLHPRQTIHQPPPRFLKIRRSQARTEQGAAIELGGAFPQPNLQAVSAVSAAAEVGRAGHACLFPESAAGSDTSKRDVSLSESHLRSGQDIEIKENLLWCEM
jgi:hypothetical protein